MQAIWFVWVIAIVAFALLEAATVNLVSVWFIGGAIAALIASLLGASVIVQIVLFVALSALLLALMRPLLRKYIMPKHTATNVDRLIGQTALVTEEISALEAGEVRIGGVLWTAKSENGEAIARGTPVRILRIEGAKLYVEVARVSAAAD